MTVAIHGYPKFKYFIPGTNTLAVGAKLFTYEVGTTTKKTSYQNFDKSTANTNPIILDANAECTLWLDGKYKLVLAPSNDTDPPASPYWTIDSVGDEDLTASVAGVTNKIPNGSFEIDSSGSGTPDNWTLTAGTGNTLATDTASQIHGDTSIKFTIASANTADAITDFFEVQEGQLEQLNFSLKASAVDANVIVRLKWYTAAQVFISNTDGYSNSASNPTSWTDTGFTYTPPSTARFAKLQILVATTGKTVNIDNFRTSIFENTKTDVAVTGQWSFDNGLTQFGSSAPGSSWVGSYEAIEIGVSSSIMGGSGGTWISENTYWGSGGWNYQTTDSASQLQLAGGDLVVQVAASGTADTAITWTTALKAESDGTVKGLGGNWLISHDGTDITPNNPLTLYRGSSNSTYIQFCNTVTGSGVDDGFKVGLDGTETARIHNTYNSDMLFHNNDLQEMYLDASGRGLVVGTPTDTGKGVGTVNAANGFYEDGVRTPWRLISDTTIGSAASNYTISSLDLDSDLEYRVEFEILNGSTSTGHQILVRLNADSGSTNHKYIRTINDGGTLSGALNGGTSSPAVGEMNNNALNEGMVVGTVRMLKNSINPDIITCFFESCDFRGTDGVIQEYWSGSIGYDSSATNITSLQFLTSGSNNMDGSSTFKVYARGS